MTLRQLIPATSHQSYRFIHFLTCGDYLFAKTGGIINEGYPLVNSKHTKSNLSKKEKHYHVSVFAVYRNSSIFLLVYGSNQQNILHVGIVNQDTDKNEITTDTIEFLKGFRECGDFQD